ncbi:unnamed protein product, partial [Polarella glacialis]
PHGIQSIVYPANRHHEVRLRQHLQQLISVRPITVKRGKSSLGRPGLSAGGTSIGTNGPLTPVHNTVGERALRGKHLFTRRHTAGDN